MYNCRDQIGHVIPVSNRILYTLKKRILYTFRKKRILYVYCQA
jgi:hypothetical protein